MYDYLVVGAGLFGCVFARIATDVGKKCLVIDSRHGVGGNCATYESRGIHVHKYGPHIFHTSDDTVWDYVRQFTKFNSFVNRSKINSEGQILSLPINLSTMNALWGVTTPEEAKKKIAEVRVHCDAPRNFEEYALTLVGRELYERVFYGYTKKQWNCEPATLPASIAMRLPFRYSWNDNYFDDTHQGVPIGGYTQMFEHMLDGIDVLLDTKYTHSNTQWQLRKLCKKVLWTGKIDEFYNKQFGALEYRSLKFVDSVMNVPDFQGQAIMNYADLDVPHTRCIEHKHFDLMNCENTTSTIVTHEIPQDHSLNSEAYYPINTQKNQEVLLEYNRLASGESGVVFGGRLATYRYLDMDDTVSDAFALAKKEFGDEPVGNVTNLR